MDLNGNGISDFKEIKDWFIGETKDLVVSMLDLDKDGKVELEEVIEVLAKLGFVIAKKI